MIYFRLTALAQTAQEHKKTLDTQRMLIWLGVIFVIVIVGGIILLKIRARLRGTSDTPEEELGFTLADLKKLRDRGELSEAEYEVARNRMVSKLRKSVGDPNADLRREKPAPDPPADPGAPGNS